MTKAGVPFKCVYVQPAEWPAKKADKVNYPSGGLPTVTFNGERMGQTMPIVRFFAMKAGCYPMNDPEMAWACDSLMDLASDTYNGLEPIPAALGTGDNAKIMEAAQKFIDNALTNACVIMEKRLEGHGKKYLVGDMMTAADLALAPAIIFNCGSNPNCPWKDAVCAALAKFPKVDAWCKVMCNDFKDYLSKRDAEFKRPM